MASALKALENATVTFQVAGTGTVTDAATGNVTATGATVTASFFLKAENVAVSTYPGVNAVETVFDGYAMAPLDARVVVGTQGTVTFAGEAAAACEVTGVRTPYGKTGLLGATLGAALGERIQLVARGQG